MDYNTLSSSDSPMALSDTALVIFVIVLLIIGYLSYRVVKSLIFWILKLIQ